jgi:fructokinase
LIDFTPAGLSPAGNALFERNPGGAPANVLAAVARLGGTAAFLGMVGDDAFGRYLQAVLEGIGVDARGLRFTKKADTTLAFVHLNDRGDRSFSFYRRPGADTLFAKTDLDLDLIGEATVFHFGSLSLTDEPARTTTLAAAALAKSKGCLVSYDPNWRPPLCAATTRPGPACGPVSRLRTCSRCPRPNWSS